MLKKFFAVLILILVSQITFSKQDFQKDTAKEKNKKKKKRKKYVNSGLESVFVFQEQKKVADADSVVNDIIENIVETNDTAETLNVPTISDTNTLNIASEKTANEPFVQQAEAQKTHTAQKGETIYSIARKYNVSVANLILLNKLSSTHINEGQNIILSGEISPHSTENTAATIKTPQQQSIDIPNRIASETVLIGCYAVDNESAAIAKANALKEKGYTAGYFYIPDYEPEGKKLYRVFAGPYPNQKTARVALEEIQKFRERAYIFKVR